MIFPETPKYDGPPLTCPPPMGPLAFVRSLLGSVFPRTPSYASAPPPSVDPEVDGTTVNHDDDIRRVVIHADQVPQPLRDVLRRLFTLND